MLQRVMDRLLFLVVDVALFLGYPRELWRLYKRHIRRGSYYLSVAAPRTTNTKFVWRKLFDHDPRFVTVTDKLAAKSFVEALGIDVAIPRTLWEGRPEDLPEEYRTANVVIKNTHGWSSNIFPAREKLEPDALLARMRQALAQRHGKKTSQWAYSHIPPRLFVEEVVAGLGETLDVKIYTGGPRIFLVVLIRTYPDGRRAGSLWFGDGTEPLQRADIPSDVNPDVIDDSPLPAKIHEAIEISKQIGAHFDHMRVDFLSDGENLFLGELTVYNLAGHHPRSGHLLEEPFNLNWDLRRSWFLTVEQRGWRAIYARALRRFCDRQAARFPSLNEAGPLPEEVLRADLKIVAGLR